MVARDSYRPCDLRTASRASNPVVVSSNSSATFVICTVPKAGCSNLRKLLYAVSSYRKPPLTDTFEQFVLPHMATYATVWNYDIPTPSSAPPANPTSISAPHSRLLRFSFQQLWQPKQSDTTAKCVHNAAAKHRGKQGSAARPSKQPGYRIGPLERTPTPRIPSHIPTFIVGRNPYVRVVSGFRDKMTANPSRSDQQTNRAVNKHFNIRKTMAWPDSPEAFRHFVRALALHGVEDIDTHFQPAVQMCSPTLKYDYYLRLEDMHAWFPCWMHGLGLRGWTEGGWATTPHGRMRVGPGRHFVTTKSVEKPPAAVLRRDAAAGGTTGWQQGEDFLWVEGDRCWWSPKNVTCADYYDAFTTPAGAVVPYAWPGEQRGGSGLRMQAAGGSSNKTSMPHDTRSADTWQRFYDQETADLVYLLYRADFEAFGYDRFVV
eukprot:jgi/Ulvmu1/9467/UM052_0036.1